MLDSVNQNHEIQNRMWAVRSALSCINPRELNRHFVKLFHFHRFLSSFWRCSKNPELYRTTGNAFKTAPNVLCIQFLQYYQQLCIYPLDSMSIHVSPTLCSRITDDSGRCSKNTNFTAAWKWRWKTTLWSTWQPVHLMTFSLWTYLRDPVRIIACRHPYRPEIFFAQRHTVEKRKNTKILTMNPARRPPDVSKLIRILGVIGEWCMWTGTTFSESPQYSIAL